MNKAIEFYITKIRNLEKRRYAKDYLASKLQGQEEPNPTGYKLGAMARQAVRWEINELLK
jgi:hypothetical protein